MIFYHNYKMGCCTTRPPCGKKTCATKRKTCATKKKCCSVVSQLPPAKCNPGLRVKTLDGVYVSTLNTTSCRSSCGSVGYGYKWVKECNNNFGNGLLGINRSIYTPTTDSLVQYGLQEAVKRLSEQQGETKMTKYGNNPYFLPQGAIRTDEGPRTIGIGTGTSASWNALNPNINPNTSLFGEVVNI